MADDDDWIRRCLETAAGAHPVSDSAIKRLSSLLAKQFRTSQPATILESTAASLITDVSPPKAKPTPKAAS